MDISLSFMSFVKGDLTWHHRRMVRAFESVIIDNEEQCITAISERGMGILKRHQLGKAK